MVLRGGTQPYLMLEAPWLIGCNTLAAQRHVTAVRKTQGTTLHIYEFHVLRPRSLIDTTSVRSTPRAHKQPHVTALQQRPAAAQPCSTSAHPNTRHTLAVRSCLGNLHGTHARRRCLKQRKATVTGACICGNTYMHECIHGNAYACGRKEVAAYCKCACRCVIESLFPRCSNT